MASSRFLTRDVRSFNLALTHGIGTRRGRGEKSFVLETRQQAVDSTAASCKTYGRGRPQLPSCPMNRSKRPRPRPPSPAVQRRA